MPEARVEEMQDRVLGATDVEIDRQPVVRGLLREGRGRVRRIHVAQVVPARAGPLRHRVRLAAELLAGRAIADLHPLGDRRERALGGARGLVALDRGKGQRERIVRDRDGRPVLLVEDGNRLAPIALPREEPVAQAEVHGALAEPARLEIGRHALLEGGRRQSRIGPRGDGDALFDVGRRADVWGRTIGAGGTRDHRADREIERARELPVALIVRRHRHDGARAVRDENIVGDPDRDPLAADRVLGIGAREDAGLRLGEIGTIEIAFASRGRDVGLDHRALGVRRDARDQRVLGRQDHVSRAKEGVGARRIDTQRDRIAGDADLEVDLGPLRAADPVALHCLDRLGPVEGLEIGEESLGIRGDAQHPLAHR